MQETQPFIPTPEVIEAIESDGSDVSTQMRLSFQKHYFDKGDPYPAPVRKVKAMNTASGSNIEQYENDHYIAVTLPENLHRLGVRFISVITTQSKHRQTFKIDVPAHEQGSSTTTFHRLKPLGARETVYPDEKIYTYEEICRLFPLSK